jgi:hypothetical protein
MNANDAALTGLVTAQAGSSVQDVAPNAPGNPTFNLVIEGVAGSAIGNSGAPYDLKISALDLTAGGLASAIIPPPPPFAAFNAGSGWALCGTGPNYQFTATMNITIPPPVPGGPLAGHVLQFVVSLVTLNAQIVSIITSEPFVLV